MIEVPTVLVLGAGSSAHVGYPLGGQLVAQMCALRGTSALDDLPGWTRGEADDFLTRLSRSGHYSIDAFLESVPARAALGKYLIARELKRQEDVDRLFPPLSAGSWYQYLFNALIPDDGNPTLRADSLSVITFNYDRSLEVYLHNALQGRFGLSAEAAALELAKLPIVHVHGILGSYPEIPYRAAWDPRELRDISEQIQIIHEIEDVGDGWCNDAFERAHGMLSRAERIFFLGFGYHADNVRRFKFFSPEVTRELTIRTTNQGIGTVAAHQMNRRLEPYGLQVTAGGFSCDEFFSHIAALE